jgi:predicted acylesterase/phospholipase RssA
MFQKNSTPRRSLILAGGGVRLAYHAGALKALEEAGLVFNHADGTSGGIFGAAMMASGLKPADACKRWRALKLRGFIKGAEGIREAIFPALGIDIGKINANTAFDATFNVCNFSRKVVESIPGDRVTIAHLVAGMSLPMFIPATKIGEDWYTDAVWIKDANLTEAVRRGARELWLVWCIGNTREYLNGEFNQYVHMIEISANAGLISELNEIADRQSPPALHIIKPIYPLPLDPAFFLKKIDANTLINMGYADTRTYLASPRPFPYTDNTTASAMTSFISTLHFRMTFHGTTTMTGTRQRVRLYVGLFVRDTERGFVLEQYTSVEPDGQDGIPGYHNQLEKAGRGRLKSSFRVDYQGASFQVEGIISIGGLLLGNKMTVTFGGQPSLFRQPLGSRLANLAHMNMTQNAGWWTRWRSSRKLLRWLTG